MHSRFHRVLRLTFAATLALSACVSSLVHAIPKAAEDENGTVEIAADVPRPRASAKAPKPASKQSTTSTKKNTKQTAKGGKSSSAKKVAKTKPPKAARGKK